MFTLLMTRKRNLLCMGLTPMVGVFQQVYSRPTIRFSVCGNIVDMQFDMSATPNYRLSVCANCGRKDSTLKLS